MVTAPPRILLLELIFVVFSLVVCANASYRTLHVSIDPSKDPITVPFDPRLALNSSDIDASDNRVKKQSSGCQQPEQVDRSKTPWLLVAVHAPWYHTYAGHYKEVECFRQAYEPLLVRYGVDIVMSGHVHAYERTKPVVDYKIDECGPVYLTVGDGGNIEGIYKDYVDRAEKGPPAFCQDPQGNAKKLFPPKYQPQACFSYQDGKFCPTQQPEWSAYREPSFGFGTLELQSATKAKWSWYKNEWPAWQVADEVTIYRTPNKAGCSSKSG